MGLKPRLRTYFVWLNNVRDHQDDEVLRLKARSASEAERLARDHLDVQGKHLRFYVGRICDLPTFYKDYPDWKGLV